MTTLDYIVASRWDRYAKRQERLCLEKYGKSYTFGSIGDAANKCVMEVRGRGCLCDWESAKAAMKAKAASIEVGL